MAQLQVTRSPRSPYTSSLSPTPSTPTGDAMLPALAAALKKASEAIADLIENDPKLDGMGSTVCGGGLRCREARAGQHRRPRAYRYRDGTLTRLSRDHSGSRP